MRIKDKINLDKKGLEEYGPITIVAFGDSVTHGALGPGEISYETVYWNRLKQKLNAYRNYMPVNVINAGIGGTTAFHSVRRIESQVLKHEPDLVIVCFGLNDVNGELSTYLSALSEIFDKCLASGAEVIFMTPNMLNTYVHENTAKVHYDYAGVTAKMQNEGKMDSFMSEGVALARAKGVKVCDCYARWKELSRTEDTTVMLSNYINHPLAEMHELFAEMLYDCVMEQEEASPESDSTMYRE